MDANDDTFEAVLRNEFQLMRKKLTDKNESQAREIQTVSTDLIRLKGDSQAQIERLKVQMLAMSNRLMRLE